MSRNKAEGVQSSQFFIPAKCGQSTSGTPNNSAFHRRCPRTLLRVKTEHQMLKSCSVLKVKASTPYYCALSFSGLATFTAGTTVNYLRDYSTVSCPQPTACLVGRRRDTKIRWRRLLKDWDIHHFFWESDYKRLACLTISCKIRRGKLQRAAHQGKRREMSGKERPCKPHLRARSSPQLPLSYCNRFFWVKIGLISHLRTHPTP